MAVLLWQDLVVSPVIIWSYQVKLSSYFVLKKSLQLSIKPVCWRGKIQYSSSGAADNHIKSNKDQHVKIVPTDHADGEIVMCRRDNESMQLPA